MEQCEISANITNIISIFDKIIEKMSKIYIEIYFYM